MKILFALAFLAVARATLEPIELPKAALPHVQNIETVQVQPISLPAPPKPYVEGVDAVKVVEFQKPDIRPLILPAEIMRELTEAKPESVAVKTPVFPKAVNEPYVVPVKVVDAPEEPSKVEAVKVVNLPNPIYLRAEQVEDVNTPVYYKPVPQEFLR